MPQYRPSFSECLAENRNKRRGPKLRPVVGANKASSRPLSHILSRVIYKVSEIIGRRIRTNCESTEEMIFEIEEVNKSTMENEDIVVGSLDVVKWYPSMELKRLIEIIMELMMEADLDVGEIDFDQMASTLPLALPKKKSEMRTWKKLFLKNN